MHPPFSPTALSGYTFGPCGPLNIQLRHLEIVSYQTHAERPSCMNEPPELANRSVLKRTPPICPLPLSTFSPRCPFFIALGDILNVAVIQVSCHEIPFGIAGENMAESIWQAGIRETAGDAGIPHRWDVLEYI